MKVFISWSGDRSRQVGELLDEWLQCVIQAVDPWMSSKDIEKGSLWFPEISDQLKNTSIGVICQQNKNKPWILFEAGALAKGLSSNRVMTFLIDLQPTDIGDPLAQFNHTLPNKESVWILIRTLNSSLGEKALKEKILESVFETYWPQFKSGFNNILNNTPNEDIEIKREEDDILLELLSITRNLDKRIRNIENDSYNKNVKRKAIPEIPIPTKAMSKPDGVRETIKNYHEFGMSDASIVSRLVSMGLSEEYAVESLRQFYYDNRINQIEDAG